MGHLPYVYILIIFVANSLDSKIVYCNYTPIKKLIYNNNGFGAYSFEFQTDDGTYRQEDGGIDSNGGLIVRGQFSYVDPMGHLYRMSYVADTNGYRPLHEEDLLHFFMDASYAVIYTYEDVELRRIFPKEFPQDTVRRTGAIDPEHLGRYNELMRYFKFPKAQINSHFEELECYEEHSKKLCRIDQNRHKAEENSYYLSPLHDSHTDRRRVYTVS